MLLHLQSEKTVSEDDFEQILPDSKIVHFKSASEFLLSLAIGKCDAGIAEKEVAQILLDRNYDYLSLDFSELQNDSTLVIAHKSILPGRNVSAYSSNMVDRSLERINGSIISNQYWKLILRGFGATVSMFLLGIVIALLAVIVIGIKVLGGNFGAKGETKEVYVTVLATKVDSGVSNMSK